MPVGTDDGRGASKSPLRSLVADDPLGIGVREGSGLGEVGADADDLRGSTKIPREAEAFWISKVGLKEPPKSLRRSLVLRSLRPEETDVFERLRPLRELRSLAENEGTDARGVTGGEGDGDGASYSTEVKAGEKRTFLLAEDDRSSCSRVDITLAWNSGPMESECCVEGQLASHAVRVHPQLTLGLCSFASVWIVWDGMKGRNRRRCQQTKKGGF